MRQWLIRLAGAAVLVVLLGAVPQLIYRSDGYVRYRRMLGELAEIERKNAGLRRENAALRRDVRRLRADPSALEAAARDELGLVKPGEIVIQIERP
jgi:cell division protein FtsB